MKKISYISSLFLVLGLLFVFTHQSNAETCILKSAKWDKTIAADSEAIGLTITGSTECAGYGVSIHIWRNDTLSGDNEVASDETQKFNSSGVARGGYTMRVQDASSVYDKYFYIVASGAGQGAGTLVESDNASKNGGFTSLLYRASSGGSPNGASIRFDFTPKTLQSPEIQKIDFTVRMIVQPGEPAIQFKTYCAGYGTPRWTIQTARSVDNDQSGFMENSSGYFTIPQNDYTFTYSYNYDFAQQAQYQSDKNNFTIPFVGRIWCGTKKVLESTPTDFKIGNGGPGPGSTGGGQVSACIIDDKYVCDATTCSGKTTEKIGSSDCNTTAAWSCIDATGKYACSAANKPDMSDQPLCTGRGPFAQIPASHCGQFPGATATQSYQYTITNPLAGGPESPFDIINIVSRWLFNISIPLAVMFILYAGFLMLTAGPNPAKVQEAKKIIINVVLALAIILIGRGFITLIRSVIELGGPG